ncbi:MAG: hypothetical protein IJ031_08725, partial [Oscillospiraceae bacterium]|nr:hypothetical protein [Oscillospiraceae bacterium]
FAKDAGLSITDVKILHDGEVVYEYADEELVYGDIEGNGKLRLEIYNAYGSTVTESLAPQAILDLAGGDGVAYESIQVEFTIAGVPAIE